MATANPGALMVQVWDLPTRLFHLSLVILVAACWWTYVTDRMPLHRVSGYGVFALLLFRFYWGFAGSSSASFRSLLAGPREIELYLRGQGRPFAGHNPLGGWSVATLLLTLTVQVVSGSLATDMDDLAPGPFSRLVSADVSSLAAHVHSLAFDVLMGLVTLHVTAVLAHTIKGDDLVGAMVHGRKRLARGVPEVRFARWWAPAPGLIAATFAVAVLWRLTN